MIKIWRITLVISLWLSITPTASASSSFEETFESLLVATEVRSGYNRNLFPHWIDADQNGCNTRFEVLIAEAVIAPQVGPNCRLTGGSWLSLFDNKRFSEVSQLDVDHLVPLAEAWRSGAHSWSQAMRTQFANDLDLPDALIAVSRSSNRAKSDRDVANWLPPYKRYQCSYVQSWVLVKAKWRLNVDLAERRALENKLLECGLIQKRSAPKLAPGNANSTPKLQPALQRYQNCALARAAKVTPIRRSSNPALYDLNKHLDRDKDGVACE